MIKNFFNKLVNSKAFYIVFSIVIAIALWFYIDLVENPEDSQTIDDIPLTFAGQEMLDSRGLMLGEGTDQTVSIVVYGKKTVVGRLNSSNVTASVDVSNVRSPGENTRSYDLTFPDWVDTDNISVVGWNPRDVSFSIIQRSSREVEVTGRLLGEVAEGYLLDEVSCSPALISVSGPQEIIDQIYRAEARLEQGDVRESFSAMADIVLLDEDRNEIPLDELTLSVDQVEVDVRILPVKEVPLRADIIDGGGATSRDVTVEIFPKTVEIAGEAEVLAGINELSVGSIDLSKFSVSLDQDMTILFPDDVRNVSGNTSARVKVEISSDFSTKRVTASNFVLANAEGMNVDIVSESLDVTVRGKQDVINEVDASNIRIVVDLTDLSGTKGLIPVKARVFVDGYTTAGAIGDYTVMIQLN